MSRHLGCAGPASAASATAGRTIAGRPIGAANAGARPASEAPSSAFYNGNLPLVLAGYNAGTKAIARFGAVPPFKETRNYIACVTRLIKEGRGGD